MDAPGNQPLGGREPARAHDYEPPRVERVLTPAELEHEIIYAGQDQSAPA
jgi:hypothetical protein